MERPRTLTPIAIPLVVALAAAIAVWTAFSLASAGPTSRVPGDANCDGELNSLDAAIVLQFDAALIDAVPCPGRADMDGDGGIDSRDAALILQYDAGLLASCPGADGSDLVVGLALDSNRTRFSHREAIPMRLSIINCGVEPVTRGYSSSQAFDFLVRDERGQPVWLWSHDYVFLAVITERTFQPGELVTYSAFWNQETNSGQQVEPGMYEVLGYDVAGRCSLDRLDQCDVIDSVVIEIEP